MTWNGRQLSTLGVDGKTVSYTYDADGQRTAKTVGTDQTTYLYIGGQLCKVNNPTAGLEFFYDDDGRALGFSISSERYGYAKFYYVYNAQGDVVQLRDAANNVTANYLYDAWGKLLHICTYSGQEITDASDAALLNPIRYRGYVYDSETGLYYLNSRYYDPQLGRFVNADGYASTGQGITGNNMFAYCGNNPVNRVDPTGQFWQELCDAFTQTIQQASGYFAVAAGVSQVDTPAPGPADVVSGALLLGGVLVCAGIATYTAITAPAPSISIPKAGKKAEAIPTTPPSSTVIYRYGGTNPGNLTPKAKDKYSGLSFSTVPMPGAAKTTIEALNATGVVYAVQDGPTHVSVRPVGATMEDWINAGSGSIWTQAVKSVVIKWDGGY